MIGILEEIGMSIEDLEENTVALGEGDRRHLRRPLRRGEGRV